MQTRSLLPNRLLPCLQPPQDRSHPPPRQFLYSPLPRLRLAIPSSSSPFPLSLRFLHRDNSLPLFVPSAGGDGGINGNDTPSGGAGGDNNDNYTPSLAHTCFLMLMSLLASTFGVSLQPPLAISAGAIAKFFHGCPDNTFQVALAGSSFSFLQRIGAIVHNGAKPFAVGTVASLAGTAVTNALISAQKAVDKSSASEVENVPILSTSVAYGVYMAISSNLRYQVLAGVIEQHILEPSLHQYKLMLSAICFAVQTGDTVLDSLLWVDYARWIGIQKAREEHKALA